MTTGQLSAGGIPPYRTPSFEVADSNACPAQPEIPGPLPWGPEAEFVWYPTIQRVVLKRGPSGMPGPRPVANPVLRYPAGDRSGSTFPQREPLNYRLSLRQAQLLEAGIFLDCHQVGMWQTLHRWLGLHPPSTLAPGRRRGPMLLTYEITAHP